MRFSYSAHVLPWMRKEKGKEELLVSIDISVPEYEIR
jgi:hypothetical protein